MQHLYSISSSFLLFSVGNTGIFDKNISVGIAAIVFLCLRSCWLWFITLVFQTQKVPGMHGCVCIFVEKGRNGRVARQKLELENIPLKMTKMKSSSSFKRSFALVSPFGSLILWPPSVKWKVRFADSVRQPNPSCIYRTSPKTLSHEFMLWHSRH